MKLTLAEQFQLNFWIKAWTPDATIAELLMASVGRISIKELGRVRAKISGREASLTSCFPEDDTMQHIVDWLTVDLMDGADWIERVDDRGRPLKLMKCGSIEQLTHEADKAMRRRLGGAVDKLGEGDEITVAKLAEGFTLVRLLTPRALDHESRRMRHCVGHGSYDRNVVKGMIQIFSMRDTDGEPCVTIEIFPSDLRQWRYDGEGLLNPVIDKNTKWSVNQIQGPSNTRPKRKHMDILRKFLKDSGWEDWKSWYPIVVDVDGVEHDADRIPAGTVFDRLSFMTVNAIPGAEIELPENLFISDGLDLRDANISKLPEGLRVCGDVNIGDSTITVWPTDMIIGGVVHGGENCDQDLIPPWIREKMEEGRQRKRDNAIAIWQVFEDHSATAAGPCGP